MSVPAGAAAPATTAAAIRRATVADLPAIQRLLTMRDARDWDEPSTRWFLHDLDPRRCMAWVAYRGDLPVGLTSMFLRDLSTPRGPARAAYWANLFVDPEHRALMLYPRLPLVMFETVRAEGLRFLYGSVRRLDLVRAHAMIGFGAIGAHPVLAKPLRPGRLIAKLKGWPAAVPLAAPLDAGYAAWLGATRPRAAGGVTVERLPIRDPGIDRLVAILAESRDGTAHDAWTPESFRYRYRRTREGTEYDVLAVRQGGVVVAALVVRVGEREPAIRAGVVMEAIAARGAERLLVPALAEAERRAHRAGCDAMIFLSGLGPEIDAVFRSSGYLVSPERYEMIVWPKAVLADMPELATAASWRFAFGDHDAF